MKMSILIVLLLSQSLWAANKPCETAFIVFVDNQFADMTSPNVAVIHNEIQKAFPELKVKKVISPNSLTEYDYAFSMIISNTAHTLTLNFRDIPVNQVLASGSVGYAGFSNPTVAIRNLAANLKTQIDLKNLTWCK